MFFIASFLVSSGHEKKIYVFFGGGRGYRKISRNLYFCCSMCLWSVSVIIPPPCLLSPVKNSPTLLGDKRLKISVGMFFSTKNKYKTKHEKKNNRTGGGENTDARARWRETTRSLLERAVSDWSAKTLLRRSRKEQQPRQTAAAAAAAAQRSVAKSTDDVDFIEEDSSTESGMGLNCLEPSEGEEGGMRVPGESTPVGFHGGISTMVDGITRSFSSIGEIDVSGGGGGGGGGGFVFGVV